MSAVLQEPIVNHWYTNLTGQLFKVKAFSMDGQGLSGVVIQFPDGKVQVINRHEWYCLKAARPGA